jgi:predicted small metal-binding protein
MVKEYTCACGWTARADTKEELLEKIREHAKNTHPSIPYEESNVQRFIVDVEE